MHYLLTTVQSLIFVCSSNFFGIILTKTSSKFKSQSSKRSEIVFRGLMGYFTNMLVNLNKQKELRFQSD